MLQLKRHVLVLNSKYLQSTGAKENVSVHRNKAGGDDLWKCCCAVEYGRGVVVSISCLTFLFTFLGDAIFSLSRFERNKD